jgi:hypothetical protein
MMLNEILKAFHYEPLETGQIGIRISGDSKMSSCFQTTELAACSMAVAAYELVSYAQAARTDLGSIEVDRRLASLWFDRSLSPLGWELPPTWDEIAGNYQTQDGWIRLHTNAPHHKAAALSVLGCEPKRGAVEKAVGKWNAEKLESAIVQAKGCAAEMRSVQAWQQHPHGKSIAESSLLLWGQSGHTAPAKLSIDKDFPLRGIKVLDLTRILAGPVATRFLAAFGAHVLRIDSPLFDDASNAPEMSLGKVCAELDLTKQSGRQAFSRLLTEADVFVHGYRPGALESLGLGEQYQISINPKLINVSLSAYGWSGPWAQRRGFDSLVQMSTGIAHAGMRWKSAPEPQPLPVQALDHATGYLMAAAVLHGLGVRAKTGEVLSGQLSLAGTAHFLTQFPDTSPSSCFESLVEKDFCAEIESTAWGPAHRLKFPVTIPRCQPTWQIPAGHFCSSAADWLLN